MPSPDLHILLFRVGAWGEQEGYGCCGALASRACRAVASAQGRGERRLCGAGFTAAKGAARRAEVCLREAWEREAHSERLTRRVVVAV